MRQMTILKADATLDDCTVGIVQAYMQFPDDLASIEEEVEAYRIWAAKGFRNTNLGQHLRNNFTSARLGGMYAGSILFKVVQYNKYCPEMRVGINKSVHMVSLESKENSKLTEKNLSTIKKYWAKYKNSSHLWASFMLMLETAGCRFPVNFVSLITVAEHLVEASTDLVEDWDPWRAPTGFPFDDAAPDIPAPDARNLSLIKKYKAPRAI
jgi:hypothetical protein